jgi:hypothetical protein
LHPPSTVAAPPQATCAFIKKPNTCVEQQPTAAASCAHDVSPRGFPLIPQQVDLRLQLPQALARQSSFQRIPLSLCEVRRSTTEFEINCKARQHLQLLQKLLLRFTFPHHCSDVTLNLRRCYSKHKNSFKIRYGMASRTLTTLLRAHSAATLTSETQLKHIFSYKKDASNLQDQLQHSRVLPQLVARQRRRHHVLQLRCCVATERRREISFRKPSGSRILQVEEC